MISIAMYAHWGYLLPTLSALARMHMARILQGWNINAYQHGGVPVGIFGEEAPAVYASIQGTTALVARPLPGEAQLAALFLSAVAATMRGQQQLDAGVIKDVSCPIVSCHARHTSHVHLCLCSSRA